MMALHGLWIECCSTDDINCVTNQGKHNVGLKFTDTPQEISRISLRAYYERKNGGQSREHDRA